MNNILKENAVNFVNYERKKYWHRSLFSFAGTCGRDVVNIVIGMRLKSLNAK